MASATDRGLDLGTAVRGAVAGAVAYLLGYVLTYAWKAPAVEESVQAINFLAELFGGQAIPTWKAVGWLYFNAHVVAIRVQGMGGDRMVNLISESDDGSLVLLYVLVVAVLFLAGAAVARYGTADRVGNAAAAGATVVVGYLPLVVVTAFLFRHAFGGDVAVAPDLVTAVALAGVVLPAFLGAVGGAVSHWLSAALAS